MIYYYTIYISVVLVCDENVVLYRVSCFICGSTEAVPGKYAHTKNDNSSPFLEGFFNGEA
jgi:hypothetical protein